jgi:hypothetical protein
MLEGLAMWTNAVQVDCQNNSRVLIKMALSRVLGKVAVTGVRGGH